MPRASAPSSVPGPRSRRRAGPSSGSSPAPAAGRGAQFDAILDAAERVVQREGLGAITIDAVAREAGLSKPGLLHHVPGKDALVRAIVDRHVVAWRTHWLGLYERLRAQGQACPAVATMMECCLAGADDWTEAERARNRVLVAALVHDERLVEPMRRVHREVASLVERDALAPGVGEAIHLAVHGLWFEWIFGLGDITPARLRVVREALRAFAAGARRRGPRRATGTPARAGRGARSQTVARRGATPGATSGLTRGPRRGAT